MYKTKLVYYLRLNIPRKPFLLRVISKNKHINLTWAIIKLFIYFFTYSICPSPLLLFSTRECRKKTLCMTRLFTTRKPSSAV